MQLQGDLKKYQQADIGVVALTYDTPALQEAFIRKFAITYPVVSDVDATSVKSLDLLNTEYKPGDSGYGVPYPGVIIISPELKVVGKVFMKGYTKRVSAEGVLAQALKVLP